MANFTSHYPKMRLLLTTLSTIGLTLGVVPLVYAQDVPTSTPPADGGAFDGAPDPTPTEVIPEPTPATEPTDDSLVETSGSSTDTSDTLPAENIPDDTVAPSPVEPGSDNIIPVGDTVEPATTATPADGTDTSGVDGTSADEAPPANQNANNNQAPANNSPRGLW